MVSECILLSESREVSGDAGRPLRDGAGVRGGVLLDRFAIPTSYLTPDS
jgi:hypothetical protein